MEDPLVGAIKRNWKSVIADWKQNEGQFEGSLPKADFPKLLRQTVHPLLALMGVGLRASLADCGVVPPCMDKLNQRFAVVKHRLLAQQHLDMLKAAKQAKKDARKAARKN